MKIYKLIALSFVLALFSAAQLLAQDKKAKDIDPAADQWTHIAEQDTATDEVYRSSTFRPTATRGGRNTITLSQDGSMEQTVIGPADKPITTTGIWKKDADGNVLITLSDYRATKYTLYADQVSEGILKKRKAVSNE